MKKLMKKEVNWYQCRLIGCRPGSPIKGSTSSQGKVNLLGSRNWLRPMVMPSWPFAG
ncbi:MAG: hypothetical protein ISS65_00190 [Desulfobacterales bacterium]|uniref:Uncharacterized protein n=1 Tax=Candidatus Desulfatibia profunda TaxID=2841695 RepID=A0A8J6TMB7_9BACT|nr:hypothetical protein [Candidatus Desulfatibia profunda]MBL7178616.1 hypothetical protein [Desulfobacterales bacterium]